MLAPRGVASVTYRTPPTNSNDGTTEWRDTALVLSQRTEQWGVEEAFTALALAPPDRESAFVGPVGGKKQKSVMVLPALEPQRPRGARWSEQRSGGEAQTTQNNSTLNNVNMICVCLIGSSPQPVDEATQPHQPTIELDQIYLYLSLSIYIYIYI